MTAPKQILIDPISATTLLVEPRANGQSLGTATGFCVKSNGKDYLVTNWHVVTDRNPDTGQVLHPSAALPDELAIAHHAAGKLGSWIIKSEKLFDAKKKPRWSEHPSGKTVDVVVLPLSDLAGATTYPLDLSLADADVIVQVAMPVSIVGFPLGLSTAGAWPIWKTGHIATDPDLDYDGRPAFLIDATTRGGMSGSPVILRLHGGYATSQAAFVIGGGPVTKFIGVYSGRIHEQSEIGRVWRPLVVTQVLANAS